jgi:hypothetical protein
MRYEPTAQQLDADVHVTPRSSLPWVVLPFGDGMTVHELPSHRSIRV